jgi:hypothetical protein
MEEGVNYQEDPEGEELAEMLNGDDMDDGEEQILRGG